MTRILALLIAITASGLLVLIPIAGQASSDSGHTMDTAPPFEAAQRRTPQPTPQSWQACASCHKLSGHQHTGPCKWCHVTEDPPQGEDHPAFKRITDGICIECHTVLP